jgi:4-hydroxythreonine-4-phosphate dehydrogenase
MSEHKLRVGISQGDINGIGLEVVLKTFADPLIFDLCTPVVFGSVKTLAIHRKALGMDDYPVQQVREQEALHPKRLNLISCYDEDPQIDWGTANPANGKYTLRSLEAACDALSNNQIDVLVTAPIDKHTIQSDTFNFPGHTEFLQARFGMSESLMLLVHENLRVGLVTGHIPISQVAQAITAEKIQAKIRLMHKSLVEDFGIRRPRIAVLSLNPHAGDNGTIGNEDQTIIAPALQIFQDGQILAFGPYPADGFFGSGAWQNFDGVLAMYHDQGLAPFKTVAFHGGVNFTAGLPIVRTSPDHGTAYDVAGKNKADESSFRQAVYLAIDIFRRRKGWQEINTNPLKVQIRQREGRDR